MYVCEHAIACVVSVLYFVWMEKAMKIIQTEEENFPFVH